jgi:hypothetical protein
VIDWAFWLVAAVILVPHVVITLVMLRRSQPGTAERATAWTFAFRPSMVAAVVAVPCFAVAEWALPGENGAWAGTVAMSVMVLVAYLVRRRAIRHASQQAFPLA